jgi:hypothetical protein
MATVRSEKHECIIGRPSKAANMAYGVTWDIKKVKRAVAEIIICMELSNLESGVEGDFI